MLKVAGIVEDPIFGFGMQAIAEHGGEYTLEKCTPVPLTEDWLLRAGFVFINDYTYSDGSKQDMWRLNKFAIVKGYQDRFTLCRTPPGYSGRWDFMNIVDYVHQLQNLYYALTGEELTLQPTTTK